MSSTSQKHRNSVAEPMKNKRVSELPGVGEALGRKLEAAGFRQPCVILGQLHRLENDKKPSPAWMKAVCDLSIEHWEDSYRRLSDWCAEFWDIKEGTTSASKDRTAGVRELEEERREMKEELKRELAREWKEGWNGVLRNEVPEWARECMQILETKMKESMMRMEAEWKKESDLSVTNEAEMEEERSGSSGKDWGEERDGTRSKRQRKSAGVGEPEKTWREMKEALKRELIRELKEERREELKNELIEWERGYRLLHEVNEKIERMKEESTRLEMKWKTKMDELAKKIAEMEE